MGASSSIPYVYKVCYLSNKVIRNTPIFKALRPIILVCQWWLMLDQRRRSSSVAAPGHDIYSGHGLDLDLSKAHLHIQALRRACGASGRMPVSVRKDEGQVGELFASVHKLCTGIPQSEARCDMCHVCHVHPLDGRPLATVTCGT